MLHIICQIFCGCVTVFSAEGEKLSVVGSPFWMAPEVLRDEAYNEKVKSPPFILWPLLLKHLIPSNSVGVVWKISSNKKRT